MNKAIIALIFLPVFASCQQLPMEELKKNGITQEEIDKTNSLNGKNGVNSCFLLYRLGNIGSNPDLKIYTNNFNLYTAEGKLLTLSTYELNNSEIIFFEFIKDEVVLIEKVFGIRTILRISRYNIMNGKLNKMINADIPCRFGNECDWINYKEKRLAFFTNVISNEGLEHSSIYEYNWETDKVKLIFGKLPLAIDAVTGRNFGLSDVKYNKKSNEFEYEQ